MQQHRRGAGPGTRTSSPAGSLWHSVAAHARQQPQAPALVWHHEDVTYRQLAEMAVEARERMSSAQLPAGPVAVLAKKSPAAIALVLACLSARRPFLLPSVDLGTETLSALLADAGCVAVLSTAAEREAPYAALVTHTLSPQARQAPSGLADGHPAGAGTTADGDHPAGAGAPEDDETTFMLTTSGSTGLPKTVPLTAGAVRNFTSWAADAFGLGPGTNVLNYAPLNFDLCLFDVWATLRAGGCAVLVDQDRAANPRYLVDVLARDEPHVVQAVPMLYELLAESAGRSGQRFATVRDVIFTGDVLPARTLRALPDLFPAARLHNVYGCTETNDSFVLELGPDDLAAHAPADTGTDAADAAAGRRVPIGEPLPGVSALIVDDSGRALSGPATGELWVHTPFQTPGYLDTAAAADKFARHEGDADGRVYFRTGDIVERDADGVVTLLGRNDYQLKVRGVRLNLLEVERAIGAYEGVAEVAVAAVPDEVAGNKLHALVVRERHAEVDSLDLRAFCAARLPRAAIPSTFEITDQSLPRNPNGKVDRREVTTRSRTATGGSNDGQRSGRGEGLHRDPLLA